MNAPSAMGQRSRTRRRSAQLLSALAAMGTVAWFGLRWLEGQQRETVGLGLRTSVQTAHAGVVAWYRAELKHALRIAEDPAVKHATWELIRGDATGWQLERALGTHLSPTRDVYALVSRDHTLLQLSTTLPHDPRLALDDSERRILELVFSGQPRLLPPTPFHVLEGGRVERTNDRPAAVAVPIADTRGVVLAALLVFDAEGALETPLRLARQGNSGETYAFDESARLLSVSRFADTLTHLPRAGDDVLRLVVPTSDRPLTRMVRAATSGSSDVDTTGYQDYRNVRVLGAWLWDDALSLGFATEMDEAEALTPYRHHRNLVVGLWMMVAALCGVWFEWARRDYRQRSAELCSARDEWERIANERSLDLTRREEQFRSLFEDARDAVIVVHDGLIVECNPAALAMFGYVTKEDFCAQRVEAVSRAVQTSPNAGQKHAEWLSGVLNPHSKAFEWVFERRDGTTFDAEVQLSPALFRDVPALQAVIRDVSERKAAARAAAAERTRTQQANRELAQSRRALARERKQLQVILNASPSAVAIETAGRLRFVNQRFAETFGRTVGDDATLDYVAPEIGSQLVADLKAGRSVQGKQFQARDATGGILDLFGTFLPFEYERQAGSMMWLVDVTQLKSVERALEGAKEAAEVAARVKALFLANMSHEIRTPMNSILGYAQLLQADTTLTSRHRERLETILRSGKHLLGLLNDILEMSKLEAGRVTLNEEVFSLRAVVEDVLRMLSESAPDDLELTTTVAPDVTDLLVGDVGKVRQVLINLVSNAIKFTDAGKVDVEARSSSRGGAEVISLAVEDTGPGIAREDRERIFDAFDQVAVGKRPGTGLGLAISRGFARLMGGDVTVESTLGVGSTFTFTFHAQAAALEDIRNGQSRNSSHRADATGRSGVRLTGTRRPSLQPDVLADAIRALPPDLLDELRAAAQQARNHHLAQLAQKVEQHSPAAAREVRALVHDFRYDVLLAALGSKL